MPPDTTEPEVSHLLARMAPVDIILLDGFRRQGAFRQNGLPFLRQHGAQCPDGSIANEVRLGSPTPVTP